MVAPLLVQDELKIGLGINKVYNEDCMFGMKKIKNNSIPFILTDIPYDAVNRSSNGLRNLDKKHADIITFDLNKFLEEIYRITSNSIVIFCGKEQFSNIYEYFASKKGTVRPIIWEKSNPSPPMNGKYVYLSGVEMAVWFKKNGGTFNSHCKNTVFKYPNGRSKLHPTEKNHKLLTDLILDNSDEGDLVFDPCFGSGSHLFVAKNLNRKYLGFEINKDCFSIATKERDL